MTLPSLDGRRFAADVDVVGGEVGPATVFTYHQDGADLWATYEGGDVARGFLVGTRTGDHLAFRYVHRNVDGETSSGRCDTELDRDQLGRLVLHEAWSWESRPGHGTSTLVELTAPDPADQHRP